MEFRKLGRTNLNVSCIGFGGAPMGIDNYLDSYDAEKNADTVIAALHDRKERMALGFQA